VSLLRKINIMVVAGDNALSRSSRVICRANRIEGNERPAALLPPSLWIATAGKLIHPVVASGEDGHSKQPVAGNTIVLSGLGVEA
jgi:hypothetical protein